MYFLWSSPPGVTWTAAGSWTSDSAVTSLPWSPWDAARSGSLTDHTALFTTFFWQPGWVWLTPVANESQVKAPFHPPLNPPPATTSNQLPSQRQPSEGCKLISQLTIQPLQPQIPPSFFRSSLSSFALLLPLRHYSSPLITFSLSALLYFSFPFFTSLLLYCALLSSPPSACSLTATIL